MLTSFNTHLLFIYTKVIHKMSDTSVFNKQVTSYELSNTVDHLLLVFRVLGISRRTWLYRISLINEFISLVSRPVKAVLCQVTWMHTQYQCSRSSHSLVKL